MHFTTVRSICTRTRVVNKRYNRGEGEGEGLHLSLHADPPPSPVCLSHGLLLNST